MDWQRVVELYDKASGRFGTGYLLAPSLVLSARHVVDGLDSMTARLLEADEDGLPGAIGPRQPAVVVWRGGDDLDLALLTPSAAGASFRERVAPALVGRLADRAAVRVDAIGFPRAMDAPQFADTLHIEALVSAWTGLRGRSLVLDVQTARPQDAEQWKGMSGAALFGGDVVVGVVEAVPAQLAEGSLRATRVDLLFEHDAASALLATADVWMSDRAIDAAYIDALPRAGHWGGVREVYVRAVVTNLCRIDHVGFAIGGAPDRRTPALAAFTAQRFATWPDTSPVTR
jgi:Trypsin-like peptidase domain